MIETDDHQKKQFFDKTFLKHIAFVSVAIVGIFFAILLFLKLYTHHNKEISLPDFTGKKLVELDSLMEMYSLRYEIIDSVFIDSREKEIIVDQEPKSGALVKKNRRIYFTIVAKSTKQVQVPDMIDLTLRAAISKLKTAGLQVGDLNYIPDMAKNAVLIQQSDGQDIDPGTFVDVGTSIDLTLGKGLSGIKVDLPILTGLTLDEAQMVLQLNSLNIGLALFDSEVIDSANAIIYKQNPNPQDAKLINLGREIDVFLKSVQ